MKKALIAAALMIGSTANTNARALLMGAGVNSCAEYARQYRKDQISTEYDFISWALGFMTGLNLSFQDAGTPTRDLDSMSPEAKIMFMNNYCDEHPLKLYYDGVVELMTSLPVLREKQDQ